MKKRYSLKSKKLKTILEKSSKLYVVVYNRKVSVSIYHFSNKFRKGIPMVWHINTTKSCYELSPVTDVETGAVYFWSRSFYNATIVAEALQKDILNNAASNTLTNYEYLKSLDETELATWLSTNVPNDNATWYRWFDEKYCGRCEDDYNENSDMYDTYCSIHGHCKYLHENGNSGRADDVNLIKEWLQQKHA